MKTANFEISSCRYCRYYNPEGRRGGFCQQLSVPVRASWAACNLAVPPFSSYWDNLDERILLENSLSLASPNDCPTIEGCNPGKRIFQQSETKSETL